MVVEVERAGSWELDKDGNCPKLRPTWDPNVDAMGGEVRQSLEGEGKGEEDSRAERQGTNKPRGKNRKGWEERIDRKGPPSKKD